MILISLGWGEHGQLGHGDQINRYKPKKVEFPFTDYNLAVSHVACGGFHTLAITSDGRVYAWYVPLLLRVPPTNSMIGVSASMAN